jgi:hypothetical protein
LQDVPKGQQVFINLGQKTNFVLLNTYGFSDPDNHHDSLSVRLQLDEADPFLTAKERMLQRFGLKNDASATITRLADTVTVPLDLLAFMRVKVRVCRLSFHLPHLPLLVVQLRRKRGSLLKSTTARIDECSGTHKCLSAHWADIWVNRTHNRRCGRRSSTGT